MEISSVFLLIVLIWLWFTLIALISVDVDHRRQLFSTKEATETDCIALCEPVWQGLSM